MKQPLSEGKLQGKKGRRRERSKKKKEEGQSESGPVGVDKGWTEMQEKKHNR